jgi:hypothetical protein
LKIFLSNGTNSILIDQIGAPQGNLMSYEYVSIPISGLLPITNTMQLTVKISDEDPNINITEAAFDHFRVTESSTLSIENVQNLTNPIIFPNPTYDKITITNLCIGDEIVFFDIQGTILKKEKAVESNLEMNLNSLRKGAYFIRVSNKVFKVVKE